MTKRSLEDVLQSVDNPVHMLRNSQIGAYVYPVVAPEFSNWRDEQRAWQTTAVLFDQSHHMAELMVEGPDAFGLLESLAINSFADFTTEKAKHFVPCNYDGYVIGDVILFRLDEERFNLVGREPTINWVQFHCETSGRNVECARDDRSPSRPGDQPVRRRHYRYQIQGPNAGAIIEKLNGGKMPDIKFFHVGSMTVAGREVPALHHGMAGEPGVEIWGLRGRTRGQAGDPRGRRSSGSARSGSGVRHQHARVGMDPRRSRRVPGERMKAYREWLPADLRGGRLHRRQLRLRRHRGLLPDPHASATASTSNTTTTSRPGSLRMDPDQQWKKVTFEWDPDDVVRVWRSLFEPEGENFKYLDLPLSNYTSATYDMVLRDDELIGYSMFSGYSFNERAFLSLGTVDPSVQEGDELILVWGEEDGGTTKPTVERHRQTEIRVRVGPTPFSKDARESYGGKWRKGG